MSEFNDLELTGVLTFDNDAGLSAGSQADILSDLCKISNASFGTDFNAGEQGTEWYSFLQSLSAALADFGGAAMQMYNNISVNNATGITLDTICSLNGIQRKAAVPAYVTLNRTRTGATSNSEETIHAGTEFVDDNNSRWASLEDANEDVRDSVASVSIELVSIDDNPSVARVAENGFTRLNTTNVKYTNEPSIPGQPQESDAQLRYRYAASHNIHGTGTLESLRSKILALPAVSYCQIQMNTSALNESSGDYAGLKAHSICVMVDGSSETLSSQSTYAADIAIAETILLHKSLGCGTSGLTRASFANGRGNISCVFNAEDYDGPKNTTYTISFVRVKPVSWKLAYQLSGDSGVISEDAGRSVYAAIDDALKNYVQSLNPGVSVSIYALYGVIANVLSNANKNWSVSSLQIGTSAVSSSATEIKIRAYEYADIPTIIRTVSST